MLDRALLETAAAAGVDVQDGTSASGLLREGAEYTSYEAPLNQRVAELPDDPSEIEDRVVALATPELSADLTPSNGGLAPTAEMS